MFKRPAFQTLLKRLQEPRPFIQVIPGPRQTGKTTIARQVAETISVPVHFAAADEPTLRDRNWLVQQWETARLKLADVERRGRCLKP
jgi:uncharacterized protein